MRRPLNTFRIISTRFGDLATGSFFGKHLGTDYATAVNTPVYSPVSGTIAETPWSLTVGQGVFINGDDGRVHRLLHLNQEFVTPGQRVNEGQMIALSGNTGSSSTGPHLHWDVRKGGTTWNASFSNYVNPESLLVVSNPDIVTLSPGRTVFLKPNVSRWRFYPPNVQPKAGREIHYLNPQKFGGLTYQVLAVPFPNTATIQSQSFGRGNIYIDSDAVIK